MKGFYGGRRKGQISLANSYFFARKGAENGHRIRLLGAFEIFKCDLAGKRIYGMSMGVWIISR